MCSGTSYTYKEQRFRSLQIEDRLRRVERSQLVGVEVVWTDRDGVEDRTLRRVHEVLQGVRVTRDEDDYDII